MSDIFFRELEIPAPKYNLAIGSGPHGRQTGRMLAAIEEVLLTEQPDWVLIYGDTNSTLAGALAAAKLHIPVAHIEAGLRSFDRSMPEELNRILTDHISDLLFTTEQSGNDNLLAEGIPVDRTHLVGNCMIDSLRAHLDAALAKRPWEVFGLSPGGYALATLHRPAAVDTTDSLEEFRQALREVGSSLPLLFPVHPRTRRRIEADQTDWRPVKMTDPLGYVEFLGLMAGASLVLTDSGGIQEETTALGVPCVTMRDNTERPVTVTMGTNRLGGTTRESILGAAFDALADGSPSGQQPPLWDGSAAVRVWGEALVLFRVAGTGGGGP